MIESSVTALSCTVLLDGSSQSNLRPRSMSIGACATPDPYSELNARLANRETPVRLTVSEAQEIVNSLVPPAPAPSRPLNARTDSRTTRFLSSARLSASQIFSPRHQPAYKINPQWTLVPAQPPTAHRVGKIERTLSAQHGAQVKAQAHEYVLANSGVQARYRQEQRDDVYAQTAPAALVQQKIQASSEQADAFFVQKTLEASLENKRHHALTSQLNSASAQLHSLFNSGTKLRTKQNQLESERNDNHTQRIELDAALSFDLPPFGQEIETKLNRLNTRHVAVEGELAEVDHKLKEIKGQVTAAKSVFQRNLPALRMTKAKLDQANHTKAALLAQQDGFRSQLQRLDPLLEPRTQADRDVEQALLQLQTRRQQNLQALQNQPPGFEGTPIDPQLKLRMRQLAQRLRAPEGGNAHQIQVHQHLIPCNEALEIISRCLALTTEGQGDQAAQALKQLMERSVHDLVPHPGESLKDQTPTPQCEQALHIASHHLATALLELPGGRELLKRLVQPAELEPSAQVQDAVAVYFRATQGLKNAANDDSRQWLQDAQEASKVLAHSSRPGLGLKEASLTLTLSQQCAFNGVRNGLMSIGPDSPFDKINSTIETSLDDWLKNATAQNNLQPSPWRSRSLLKEATHDLSLVNVEAKLTMQLKIACNELLKITTQQLVDARSHVLRARRWVANSQSLAPGASIGMPTKVPMSLIEAHNVLHFIKEQLDQDIIHLLNPKIWRSIQHASKRQQKAEIAIEAQPSGPLKKILALNMASPASPPANLPDANPSPSNGRHDDPLLTGLSKLKASHSTHGLQALKILSASVCNLNTGDITAAKSRLIEALDQAQALQERYNAFEITDDVPSPNLLFEVMSQTIADASQEPTFGSVRLSDSHYKGLATAGLVSHALAVISAGTATPEFELQLNRSKTSSLSISRDLQGIQQHLVNQAVMKRVHVRAGLGSIIMFWASHERAWVSVSEGVVLRMPKFNGKTHEQLTQDFQRMIETSLNWRKFEDEAHQPLYKNPLQALLHQHPEISISAVVESGTSYSNNRNFKNLTGLIEPACNHDGARVIPSVLCADKSSTSRKDSITTTTGTQGIEVVGKAKVTDAPNHFMKKPSLTVDTADSVLFRQPDGSIVAERSAAYTHFSKFEATVNLHREKWIQAGMQAHCWPKSFSQSDQRLAATEALDQFMHTAKLRSVSGNVTLHATMRVKPDVCAEMTGNLALEQLARTDNRGLEADVLRAAREEILGDESSYQAAWLALFESGEGSKNVDLRPIIERKKVQMASATRMVDCYPPMTPTEPDDAVSSVQRKGSASHVTWA